ncbi:hypothetical protein [Kineosporia sp. R_H_3]|uniref:hypothetical protein n=1 Tax=Kineosporia sp. R_H_3 TaxID=1961848 RepID=UPI00117BD213|nr:hypothetical protein [Kineosporia sp. R_H_3]
MVAAVRERLPYSWSVDTGVPERVWAVEGTRPVPQATVDGTPIGAAGDELSLVDLVAQDLELWVAEHARGLVFVHCGVVAVDGKAVLLPGPSRAGKSTLVAALVDAGATYYSDEFAPVDASGLVHAYRRVPRQRPGSPAFGRQDPQDISSVAPPLPVGFVASLTWAAGADLALTPGSQADSLLRLLSNTVCARSRSVEALDALTVATSSAVHLHGVRGDADIAARELLRIVEDVAR